MQLLCFMASFVRPSLIGNLGSIEGLKEKARMYECSFRFATGTSALANFENFRYRTVNLRGCVSYVLSLLLVGFR